MADWIQSLAPSHIHRVHHFAGGLSEFWNWSDEGISEVVNDVNGFLTNFYEVLRDPQLFGEFQRMCSVTPFSEEIWNSLVLSPSDPPILRAWKFFVHIRQSMSGRGDCFTPISRTRTRRGMNEQVSSWLTAIDGMLPVHQRLRRVLIRNSDFRLTIQQEDSPGTLHYLDPTYHPDTRTAKDVFEHEMSVEDHDDMLKLLTAPGFQGKFMLSGYRCPAYDEALKNCRREDYELPNHSAKGKSKSLRVESLWMNF